MRSRSSVQEDGVLFLLQGFEDNIRKNRTVISNWIKYAQWEESLNEIQRYISSIPPPDSSFLQLPLVVNYSSNLLHPFLFNL